MIAFKHDKANDLIETLTNLSDFKQPSAGSRRNKAAKCLAQNIRGTAESVKFPTSTY